jgi:hypothetical protein
MRRKSTFPEIMVGWTSGDHLPIGQGCFTHGVRPVYWSSGGPRAGETLCGHVAHIDHRRRAFEPPNVPGPVCEECARSYARTLAQGARGAQS